MALGATLGAVTCASQALIGCGHDRTIGSDHEPAPSRHPGRPRAPALSGADFLTRGDAPRHAGDGGCVVGMAPMLIMKVLTPAAHHHEGPCPMSSPPTYTVVDQFDEDEFPDVAVAPAALLAALRTVPDPRQGL